MSKVKMKIKMIAVLHNRFYHQSQALYKTKHQVNQTKKNYQTIKHHWLRNNIETQIFLNQFITLNVLPYYN
jgi:hypothetical protein